MSWYEKPYATREPEPAEWVEHWPEWRLIAEDPIYVAVLLAIGGEVRFGRLPACPPSRDVRVDLKLTRYRESSEWPTERLVHVSLYQNSGGAGDALSTMIVSEALWLDPRDGVTAVRQPKLSTGTWFELARAEEVGLVASAVVLGADEVRIVRDRWRAKPSKLDAIPEELDFLNVGRRAGVVSAGYRSDDPETARRGG